MTQFTITLPTTEQTLWELSFPTPEGAPIQRMDTFVESMLHDYATTPSITESEGRTHVLFGLHPDMAKVVWMNLRTVITTITNPNEQFRGVY
jgi:hypothetical protein